MLSLERIAKIPNRSVVTALGSLAKLFRLDIHSISRPLADSSSGWRPRLRRRVSETEVKILIKLIDLIAHWNFHEEGRHHRLRCAYACLNDLAARTALLASVDVQANVKRNERDINPLEGGLALILRPSGYFPILQTKP